MRKHGRDPGAGLAWGLIMIAFGVLFLLNELGVIWLKDIWSWWPFIFIGIGAFQIVLWRSAEAVASGFGMTLFGFWFLISEHGWFGLGWSDSWPLAVVAVGLSMLARAALEPLFRNRNVEEVDHHA